MKHEYPAEVEQLLISPSTVTIEKQSQCCWIDFLNIYIYRKIYFEELSHTVMGTAQSKIYGAVRKFKNHCRW